jgi:hypothetical protein
MADEHLAQDKDAWGPGAAHDHLKPQDGMHRCMWRGCGAGVPFQGYCPEHQEMRKQGLMPEPPAGAAPVQVQAAAPAQRPRPTGGRTPENFDASAMMFVEAERSQQIMGGGGVPEPENVKLRQVSAQPPPPQPGQAVAPPPRPPAQSVDLVAASFELMDAMSKVPEEHRQSVFRMLDILQQIPDVQRQQVLSLVTSRLK